LFQSYLAYLASAGSGKTFALSVRYISLLFMGVNPSNILAVTFTNKAVSEMLSRIATSLIELDHPKNESFLEAISQQTNMSKKELLETKEEVLNRFLTNRNFISTLDGFFTSIVKSSALKIGLDSNFTIKMEDNELLKEPFLQTLYEDNLLGTLLELAIEIEDKRFDKLFDLLEYLYKIYPLLPTFNDLQIDISTANIDEKREEIYQALQEAKVSVTALKNFEPMSVTELMQRAVFGLDSLLDNRNYKKYVEKNPHIDTLFNQLKEQIGLWAKKRERSILEKLLKLFEQFKRAKLKSSIKEDALGFDDISAFGYEIMHLVSKAYLDFKLDTTFEHILIDEFQDTSTIQYLLLKPFIDEIFNQDNSKFKSFFYVGDTKQSLYRFRGGVEELFGVIAKKYNVNIAFMDTSYRSSQNVVNEVNRWFEPNMLGYTPQKAHRKIEGFVEVIEAEDIVFSTLEQIKKLIEAGARLSDITVLVVTNKDAIALQEVCFTHGIETILKTSSSIKTLPKIASLVAMVRYLLHESPLDGYNFALSCGIEKFELEWFNPFFTPFEVLHRLIKEFNYFEGDKNILKLLEFSLEFEEIDTFLKEFEKSNIAIAQNTLHGVNLMTIHGSKGLEFEHVIVMDRVGKESVDTSVFIFDYNDELFIQNIFYRMKARDSFDMHYKKALEEKKKLKQKDTLNLLYVALTRASDNMIVVKKIEKSLFENLFMHPCHCGELQIHQAPQTGQKNPPKFVEPIDFGRYNEMKIEKKQSLEISFGNTLHYTLELLKDFDVVNLDTVLEISFTIYGEELSLEDKKEIYRRVKSLCEHPTFKDLLQDKKIFKELPIIINGESKQIDLMLEGESEIFIIEYKSSFKFHDKHLKQIERYVEASQKIMKKPTKGFLIYLLKEEIKIV